MDAFKLFIEVLEDFICFRRIQVGVNRLEIAWFVLIYYMIVFGRKIAFKKIVDRLISQPYLSLNPLKVHSGVYALKNLLA